MFLLIYCERYWDAFPKGGVFGAIVLNRALCVSKQRHIPDDLNLLHSTLTTSYTEKNVLYFSWSMRLKTEEIWMTLLDVTSA